MGVPSFSTVRHDSSFKVSLKAGMTAPGKRGSQQI